MIATYEGRYALKIEAENAVFRLKLMGHKAKIKTIKPTQGRFGYYEVYSDA